MESATRTNYIFVDYENVQDLDLDLIAGKPVKVFFIVGQRQKSLPTTLSKQTHKYHDQVEWIESEGASRNALDLVLAYRVGVQAKADPEGYFHVLSKDKDYDALIKHLRAQDLRACRDEVFSKVSALVELSKMTLHGLEQHITFTMGVEITDLHHVTDTRNAVIGGDGDVASYLPPIFAQ